MSPSITAALTILCSLVWLVAACDYYATSGLGLDWSATPKLWVMAVVICPAVCFTGCMILFDARRRKQRSLSLLEFWGLIAAFIPVTVGSLLSVWAVRALFHMCGI